MGSQIRREPLQAGRSTIGIAVTWSRMQDRRCEIGVAWCVTRAWQDTQLRNHETTQLPNYLTNGSQTANVVPKPSRELTSIFPPCCSTIQWAMDSPSPNPAVPERVRDFSARKKRSKI